MSKHTGEVRMVSERTAKPRINRKFSHPFDASNAINFEAPRHIEIKTYVGVSSRSEFLDSSGRANVFNAVT